MVVLHCHISVFLSVVAFLYVNTCIPNELFQRQS